MAEPSAIELGIAAQYEANRAATATVETLKALAAVQGKVVPDFELIRAGQEAAKAINALTEELKAFAAAHASGELNAQRLNDLVRFQTLLRESMGQIEELFPVLVELLTPVLASLSIDVNPNTENEDGRI